MTTLLDVLEIPALSRFDMYAQLGLLRVLEPDTEVLMQERAEAELVDDEFDSPHSRAWFLSYHASEAPGDPTTACARYLTYRMMNFPFSEIVPPWVTTCGSVGKAGELDVADAWFRGGRMLAVPEDDAEEGRRLRRVIDAYKQGAVDVAEELYANAGIHQLGFVDAEHWMTASTDLPILPRGWRRPFIAEIKGKSDDVLDEMIDGRLLQRQDGTIERVGRGPDEKHVLQLKATIGLAHEYDWGWVTVCPDCWFIVQSDVYERLGLPGGVHPRSDAFGYCPRCQDYPDLRGREHESHFHLDPPISGEIYYWSRSWPRKTKSFYYEHDPAFMAGVRGVLKQAQRAFIEDRIPERPEHFQWSVGACKQCRFKISCRIDSGLAPRQKKVRAENVRHKLTESANVERTLEMRPRYDPQAVRERVLQEWS